MVGSNQNQDRKARRVKPGISQKIKTACATHANRKFAAMRNREIWPLIAGYFLFASIATIHHVQAACNTYMRARFADGSETNTVAGGNSATELGIQLEYTHTQSGPWKALKWNELAIVHTSRLHVALVSEDTQHFLHTHPEQTVIPDEIDIIFKVSVHFPSTQRYVIVLDWAAIENSLPCSSSQEESVRDQESSDVFWFDDSGRLREGHGTLSVIVTANGPNDLVPAVKRDVDVRRVRQVLLRNHDAASPLVVPYFSNLGHDTNSCCHDKWSCIETRLDVVGSGQYQENQVRVVPVNSCMRLRLTFVDQETGKPVELEPFLQSAAHVIVVDEDMRTGLHIHNIPAPPPTVEPTSSTNTNTNTNTTPKRRLGRTVSSRELVENNNENPSECPEHSHMHSINSGSEIGDKVDLLTSLPHAGKWIIFATTSYANQMVISKFEVLAATSIDSKSHERCVHTSFICTGDGMDCVTDADLISKSQTWLMDVPGAVVMYQPGHSSTSNAPAVSSTILIVILSVGAVCAAAVLAVFLSRRYSSRIFAYGELLKAEPIVSSLDEVLEQDTDPAESLSVAVGSPSRTRRSTLASPSGAAQAVREGIAARRGSVTSLASALNAKQKQWRKRRSSAPMASEGNDYELAPLNFSEYQGDFVEDNVAEGEDEDGESFAEDELTNLPPPPRGRRGSFVALGDVVGAMGNAFANARRGSRMGGYQMPGADTTPNAACDSDESESDSQIGEKGNLLNENAEVAAAAVREHERENGGTSSGVDEDEVSEEEDLTNHLDFIASV